jgi:hypothetical protein
LVLDRYLVFHLLTESFTVEDNYGLKIKGAVDFPLSEGFGADGMQRIDKYGGYNLDLALDPRIMKQNLEKDQARLE